MATSRQVPARHDLEAVAGYRFSFTVTTTGATITSPAVTIKDGTRTTVTADPSTPTVSQASAVTTVAFTAADMAALAGSGKKSYTYTLEALVDGEGPYPLISGVLSVVPPGSSGRSSSTSSALTVTVGAAALSLSVDMGGTSTAVLNATRDYYYAGAGDGVTNHNGELDAIFAAGNVRVHFTPGTFLFSSSVANDVLNYINTSNVTVKGAGKDATTFVFEATDTGFHAGFLIGTSARNVVIEDLTIERGSNYGSIMFNLGGSTGVGVRGLTVRNCRLDGSESVYAEYSHGIGYANSGTYSDLVFDNVDFVDFAYSFLMQNASAAIVDRIRVTNCTFSDCGFDVNAPNGTVRDVVVSGCRFTGNVGYACGLAHAEGATIANNHYLSLTGEAIHIEDYSTNVTVYGNRIIECNQSLLTAPVYIFDSNNIDFHDNDIVNTSETGGAEKVQLYVLGLESGTTAGGRTRAGATYNISIHNNRFTSGPNGAILLFFTGNYAIDNNHFQGGLAISDTFTESGTNVREALKVVSSEPRSGGSICGNKIRGYRSATWRSTNSRSFSDGTVIANNTIRECRHGIQARNTMAVAFAGNNISRCIYPMSIGARAGGSDGLGCNPYSTVGNVLYGNQYPASLDGRLTVVASGAATIGSGVTVNVVATDIDLPNGAVVTFSGGGVLTLTSAKNADSTSLTGNLTTANIVSGQYGVATGLKDRPYDGNVDVRGTSGNVDSVAGRYGF